jgi:hypothetical protein
VGFPCVNPHILRTTMKLYAEGSTAVSGWRRTRRLYGKGPGNELFGNCPLAEKPGYSDGQLIEPWTARAVEKNPQPTCLWASIVTSQLAWPPCLGAILAGQLSFPITWTIIAKGQACALDRRIPRKGPEL